MKNIALIFLIMYTLFTYPARAQNLTLLLVKCSEIQDDLKRLVCFDNLAASQAANAISNKTSNAKINESRNTLERKVTELSAGFGSEHIKKSAKATNEVHQVLFFVDQVTQDQFEKFRITFTNGQQWKQTDDGTIRLKVGDKVLLTKGVFGAVYLKQSNIDSNRKIRIKRIK